MPTYRELMQVLDSNKLGPERASAVDQLLGRGWWSFKVLKSRTELQPGEFERFAAKATEWCSTEDRLDDLLKDHRFIPPLRTAAVRRLPEIMGPGDNSVVALWALRGAVFPKEVPMTSDERSILLDVFKRPPRKGSDQAGFYAHSLISEYREYNEREGRGITFDEVKELLPFALPYLYCHWYDAMKFLENETLSVLLDPEQRARVEKASKKAA